MKSHISWTFDPSTSVYTVKLGKETNTAGMTKKNIELLSSGLFLAFSKKLSYLVTLPKEREVYFGLIWKFKREWASHNHLRKKSLSLYIFPPPALHVTAY